MPAHKPGTSGDDAVQAVAFAEIEEVAALGMGRRAAQTQKREANGEMNQIPLAVRGEQKSSKEVTNRAMRQTQPVRVSPRARQLAVAITFPLNI